MQFGKFKVEIILAWYRNSVYSVAMLPAPRSVAICLVLLFGVSSRLHAQASQSPSPIYYLLDHVNARIPKGLLGFEMGTQVELVKDFGDRLRVKRGDLEFDVDRRLLTNDLSIVSQAWENYRAQQEQLATKAAAAAHRRQQAQEQAAAQRQAEQQRQAEIQRQQQAAQWQAQQQPEIPWALQAVQAIQAEQTRQTELQQAEQQRQAGTAQLAVQAQYQQKARAAEQRASELESRLNQVRADERFEYNKAAEEGGNQATYYVEEAFDRKIRSLQGKIEDSRQEKNAWQQRAWQAEQH